MATITITDLPVNRALDRKAMSCVKGAGAPWVFGWITPFVAAVPGAAQIVNFFQTNNIFIADQINNQFQMIEINNSAANANINLAAQQGAINFKA